MPDKEQFADLSFPVNGLDLSLAYGQQRPGTTVLGDNVVVFEPLTSRGRGGSRAGLLKYIPGQIPGGPHKVQHLNVVVDPSGQALLDNFDPGTDAVDDPSNLGRSRGRRIRIGIRRFRLRRRGSGSGRQPSKSSKKTPVIQWATPADITVGTPLDGSILNAVAVDSVTLVPLSGSYVYTPPSGTVLPAGDHQTLKVKFTPDTTTAQFYVSASGSVQINVKDLAIQFVQATADDGNGTPRVATCTTPADVTKDNLLVVFVFSNNNRNNVSDAGTVTVSDSAFHTWTQAGGYFHSAATGYLGTMPLPGFFLPSISCWYTYANATGPLTVTATATQNSNFHTAVALAEYKNVKASAALDGINSFATDVGTTSVGTGAVTIAQSGEVVLGALACEGITGFSPDSPYNTRLGNPSGSIIRGVLDKLDPLAGGGTNLTAVVVPFTFGGGLPLNYSVSFGVSFKGK